MNNDGKQKSAAHATSKSRGFFIAKMLTKNLFLKKISPREISRGGYFV